MNRWERYISHVLCASIRQHGEAWLSDKAVPTCALEGGEGGGGLLHRQGLSKTHPQHSRRCACNARPCCRAELAMQVGDRRFHQGPRGLQLLPC